MARVGVSGDVDFDALIEFRRRGIPSEFDSILRVKRFIGLGGHGLAVPFAVFLGWHVLSALGDGESVLSRLFGDHYSHAAGGAFDNVHRGFDIVRVEFFNFRFGDLLELVAGDASGYDGSRCLGSAFDPSGLFEQRGCRWRFYDEAERTISEYVDGGANHHAALRGRSLVELLDEERDVDAVLTECWSDRRCRCGFASGELKIDFCDDFPCHFALLPVLVSVKSWDAV